MPVVEHSNEQIRRQVLVRGGDAAWADPDATAEEVTFLDYTVWTELWDEALDLRDISVGVLTDPVKDALCKNWPADYGDLSTWDLDGGPHMDRLARELTRCGFGMDGGDQDTDAAVHAIENLTW